MGRRPDYSVVVRCEIHGTAVKPGMKAGEKQYMSAFALNEWDSKLAGGVEWRQKIDTQVSYYYCCRDPRREPSRAAVGDSWNVPCVVCVCVCFLLGEQAQHLLSPLLRKWCRCFYPCLSRFLRVFFFFRRTLSCEYHTSSDSVLSVLAFVSTAVCVEPWRVAHSVNIFPVLGCEKYFNYVRICLLPHLLFFPRIVIYKRGAILATELKNNSAKLARWTAQSILSGADQMKIG